MKNLIKLSVLFAILLNFTNCKQKKEEHQHSNVDHNISYTCPMHPQVVSDQPGSCPICNMDLVSYKKSNKDSPSIMLSESQIQLGNINSMAIKMEKLKTNKIILGRITENQNEQEVISSRVEGRIEKLYFKETGLEIRKGQPLYEIYSEPLLILQQEFLLAQEQSIKLGPEIPRFKSFLEASRKKLLLYGMNIAQINKLSNEKYTNPRITFFAPVSGIISELGVAEGSYMNEGNKLFSIVRLDKVWVEAELYNGEASKIQIGDKVEVAVDAFEKHVTGKVAFVSPEFRSNSQIQILRVEIANPELKFIPGMHANVLINNSENKSINLPIDAVIRNEDGAHIWVTAGKNTYIPKLVRIGKDNQDQIEILEGLNEIDTVVTSGAYLLYSEYTLKKGGNLMSVLKQNGINKITTHQTSAKIIGTKINKNIEKQFVMVFSKYLLLKEELIASEPLKVKLLASNFSKSVNAVDQKLLNGDEKKYWEKERNILVKNLHIITSTNNLESQRTAFAPISESLYKSLKMFTNGNLTGYYQYCPMALHNKGVYWISDSRDIKNPYFGNKMLNCGEEKGKLN